jgi:hypothetical protein
LLGSLITNDFSVIHAFVFEYENDTSYVPILFFKRNTTLVFKNSIIYYLFKLTSIKFWLCFLIFTQKYLIMQTASVPGFLRTLLIIIAFYYIFKFLIRLLLPYLLKKMAQKAAQQMNQQAPFSNQQTQNQQTKSNTPPVKKKVGEYIDYEEIE